MENASQWHGKCGTRYLATCTTQTHNHQVKRFSEGERMEPITFVYKMHTGIVTFNRRAAAEMFKIQGYKPITN